MELEDIIKARRSVRKYENKPIERSVIEKIIGAAIMAPSWKNSQTARYHVIDSKEILEKIKKECLPEFNQENCKEAPVLIVTTFVKDRAGFSRDGIPNNELNNGWGIYDLGLHNQTALLKATELGLSSLVMGIRDENKIRALLNIDEKECIVSIIALGVGKTIGERPNRKTVEAITRFY